MVPSNTPTVGPETARGFRRCAQSVLGTRPFRVAMKKLKTVEPFLPPLERVVFFDIETTGIDPFVDKDVTVQVRHKGKTTIWKEWELSEKRCIEEFFRFLYTVY